MLSLLHVSNTLLLNRSIEIACLTLISTFSEFFHSQRFGHVRLRWLAQNCCALTEYSRLIGRACNQWTRASRWHARTKSHKLPRANTCRHLAMEFAHVHLSNALPVYHPLPLVEVTNASANTRQPRTALPAELKAQNWRVSWFGLSNFVQLFFLFYNVPHFRSAGKETKPWTHTTRQHCGQNINDAFACSRNGWWKGEGMFNWLNFSFIFKLVLILCFIFAGRTCQPYWKGGYLILLFRRSEQLQRDSESGTWFERKGAMPEETPIRRRCAINNKWQQSPRRPQGYSQRRWAPTTEKEATVMEAISWLMNGSERKTLPYIFHIFHLNIITTFLTTKPPSMAFERRPRDKLLTWSWRACTRGLMLATNSATFPT